MYCNPVFHLVKDNTTKLLTEEYIVFHLQAELPNADLLKQSDFISLLF